MQSIDIETALAAAGIEPAGVTSIEEVGTGWECRIFRVTRPGVEDVAFRLYTGDPSGGTMRAEVAAYRALEQVDYPAPRLLAEHPDSNPLGAPFVLIDWLEGPVADSLGVSFDALDLLTDLLVRLHDIVPITGPGDEATVRFLTNQDLIDDRFRLLAGGELDGFRPALQWLADEVPNLQPMPLRYVHMDFHPRNIIITRHGPVVFDWGSFAVADPRLDLAWTLLLAKLYIGRKETDHVLAGYRNRRPDGLDDLLFFEVSAVWRRFATIVMMLREDLPQQVKQQVLEAVELLRPEYERMVEATGTAIAEVERLYA